jgi:hypothetical protein
MGYTLRRIFLNSIYAETGIGEIIESKRCLWNYFRCQQRNQCSGLQYMAPENVYWEYSAELETSSKFVSILPERKLFKHTRYAAILSKRIF